MSRSAWWLLGGMLVGAAITNGSHGYDTFLGAACFVLLWRLFGGRLVMHDD